MKFFKKLQRLVNYNKQGEKTPTNNYDKDSSTPHYNQNKLLLSQYIPFGNQIAFDQFKDNFDRGEIAAEQSLYYAAKIGRLDIVEYISNNSIESFTGQHHYGITPAMLAARSGHLDIVKYFINAQKIDPLTKDFHNTSLLHFAAQSRNLELVKYLVEEIKLDVTATDQFNATPLHSAAFSREQAIMRYLVNNGADNTATDQFGRMPFGMTRTREETRALSPSFSEEYKKTNQEKSDSISLIVAKSIKSEKFQIHDINEHRSHEVQAIGEEYGGAILEESTTYLLAD